MSYTLGEAAKATGKDRATISRAIKKGRISAAKDESGQWEIDPSELHRVYPALKQDNTAQDAHATDNATIRNGDLVIENRELKARLEASNEQHKLKDRVIDDLQEDRDKWRQQATALLTDQTKKPPETRPIGLWLAVGAVVLILGAILAVLVLRGPISVATGPGSNPALSGTL